MVFQIHLEMNVGIQASDGKNKMPDGAVWVVRFTPE
jgi:hypothetical protein